MPVRAKNAQRKDNTSKVVGDSPESLGEQREKKAAFRSRGRRRDGDTVYFTMKQRGSVVAPKEGSVTGSKCPKTETEINRGKGALSRSGKSRSVLFC